MYFLAVVADVHFSLFNCFKSVDMSTDEVGSDRFFKISITFFFILLNCVSLLSCCFEPSVIFLHKNLIAERDEQDEPQS